MKLKEILVVTNDKGGVGKTTTAVNLAIGLQKEKYSVLLVDMDSQRYASMCAGWELEQETDQGLPTIFDTLSRETSLPVYKSDKGIYFTPSSSRMTAVENFLKQSMTPCEVLKYAFAKPLDDHSGDGLTYAVESFDYVVIDCPPSLGSATLNAMAIGTGLIIPIQMEGFAVRGMVNVLDCYHQVKEKLNSGLEIKGFLFVMVNPRLKLTKQYIAGLREKLEGFVFDRYIRRDQKVPESQDSLDCVLRTNPWCNAANDYRAWIKELLSDKKEEGK